MRVATACECQPLMELCLLLRSWTGFQCLQPASQLNPVCGVNDTVVPANFTSGAHWLPLSRHVFSVCAPHR